MCTQGELLARHPYIEPKTRSSELLIPGGCDIVRKASPLPLLYPPVPRDVFGAVTNDFTPTEQSQKGLSMEQDLDKEIMDILGGLMCSKSFKCYKRGFKNLCKAEDVGVETFLKCLEEHPAECKFALPTGHSYYCSCPLRVYIAKKLKK
jgi:hypothetical protein